MITDKKGSGERFLFLSCTLKAQPLKQDIYLRIDKNGMKIKLKKKGYLYGDKGSI